MRVMEDVEKGPIQQIRESFALKAVVEKEDIKLQNQIRKLGDEQKNLYGMRQAIFERFDDLEKVYVKE